MIHVQLPYQLRVLAAIEGPVLIDAAEPTLESVMDALEARYPALRGAIRERRTGRRRPLVRFFACRQDLSGMAPETRLPDSVACGEEPLLVVGAIAGG